MSCSLRAARMAAAPRCGLEPHCMPFGATCQLPGVTKVARDDQLVLRVHQDVVAVQVTHAGGRLDVADDVTPVVGRAVIELDRAVPARAVRQLLDCDDPDA